MCRFLAYKGHKLSIDELLFQPKHSLVQQSIHSFERSEPLNGDGFGVGWFDHSFDEVPAVFTSVQPAWNNLNLKRMAPKIASTCVLAHVRAATFGTVSQTNCHPFHAGPYLFMHNGDLGDFAKIKRRLRRELSDDAYLGLKGDTDSEHFFALLKTRLKEAGAWAGKAEDVAKVFADTIHEVSKMIGEDGVGQGFFLNGVLSDGHTIWAARFVDHSEKRPHSLYYAAGERFVCAENGLRQMEQSADASKKASSLLLASERPNDLQDHWLEFPANQLLVFNETLEFLEV